jgi:hypothetical protein
LISQAQTGNIGSGSFKFCTLNRAGFAGVRQSFNLPKAASILTHDFQI